MLIFKGGKPLDLTKVTIIGEGCQLRSLTANDAGDIYTLFTPEITRYMVPTHNRCLEDAADFIAIACQNMLKNIECILVIEDERHQFCGLVGVHGRSIKYQPELGVWVAKTAQGKQLGLKAIGLVMAWAKKHCEISAFLYPVDRRNYASRRIPVFYGGQIFDEKIVPTMDPGRVLDEVVYRIPVERI